MAIGIIGSKSPTLLEVQGDSATRNAKDQIRICAVSFHHAETHRGSLKQP